MNYSTFTRLVAGLVIAASALCLPVSLEAQDIQTSTQTEVIRVSNADGAVSGQVYTMLDDQKTPLVGNVSLTDLAGTTVSSLKTDADGNFSFKDLKEGSYKAICIAGDYVGDADIEVVRVSAAQESESVGIAVGPASSDEILNAYAALPAAQFSSGGCNTCNAAPARTYSTCNSCSGGVGLRSFGRGGGGFGGGGFGGGGFGGGLLGGSGGFGRLALLGGALAIPLALGGDDDASPAGL